MTIATAIAQLQALLISSSGIGLGKVLVCLRQNALHLLLMMIHTTAVRPHHELTATSKWMPSFQAGLRFL